ncbi:hypothetical protein [Pseudomonas akapageensis]|uniref:hypothetical protein n=1 Tax=Pseudomonas akapageensis TaxID=2609961 RepID=UPI001409D17C|nr:hypothetical protein [Pseudomonas akapageensis]
MNHDQVLKQLREEMAQLAADMRRPARPTLLPFLLGAATALVAAMVGFKLFF